MMMFLQKLEPRFEPKYTILMDELDESNEVIFICRGAVVIGYEINKVKKYCIKVKNHCIIGAFGATFNQRSEYVYTALTDVHGFFIRLENWL